MMVLLSDLLAFFLFLQIKIFCEHPIRRTMSEQKLEIHKDCTLNEAVAIAHKVRESYHCAVYLGL